MPHLAAAQPHQQLLRCGCSSRGAAVCMVAPSTIYMLRWYYLDSVAAADAMWDFVRSPLLQG